MDTPSGGTTTSETTLTLASDNTSTVIWFQKRDGPTSDGDIMMISAIGHTNREAARTLRGRAVWHTGNSRSVSMIVVHRYNCNTSLLTGANGIKRIKTHAYLWETCISGLLTKLGHRRA